ncbi:heavy metal-binding domain-containing protein [Dactylosporangium sp. NPDC051541]|uniref:heavy metal-binding domain-containing protein n=1 Tax=Dactylosporangium sp. NPDC051541 TaxID=3363977 RepID=UPI00379D42E8
MPFTSGPALNDFAGLRTLGFEPVGRVTGLAVFRVVQGFASCTNRPRLNPVTDEVSQEFEREARRLAVERLRRKCIAAGGDGVIGVGLEVRPFFGEDTLEYVASGTAVRICGSQTEPRARPFTAGVGAADFVKLLRAGWMAASFLVGVAVKVVHDRATDLELTSVDNVELTTATKLVRSARVAARSALAVEAAHVGGHTVILDDIELSTFEQTCNATRREDNPSRTWDDPERGSLEIESEDRVALAVMTGTAIVPLHRPIGPPAGRPLTIMRLDRDRRPAANVNRRNSP